MTSMHVLKLILVISYFVSTECSRKISCSINPGLDDTSGENSTVNVVHITSEGKEDVMHFVWSTYKLPSVIVASTTKNTTLLINSTKLKSFEKDSILFENGKPLESIGVTFSKLWELHYDSDSSSINDASSVEDLDMESFDWSGLNETLTCSDSYATVILKGGNSESPFSENGALKIQFSVSGDQELSKDFPQLVFTGNSTLLKFIFENLHSNISFTRYGLGISLFSTLTDKCESDSWKKTISTLMNDEVSPGVFSDVELLAPCSDVKDAKSSFMSWRPVAYTGVKPIVANTSDVTMSEMIFSSEFHVYSIAELFFQDKSNISNFNITFGTPGDGCYVATKYTSWTLMVGTGSMVESPMSSLVIILAAVGIGFLLLFMIIGPLYVLYQKCKVRDDDLLLN